MKQVGFNIRVVFSGGVLCAFALIFQAVRAGAQPAPPPNMPSPDAITRLMEEERRLRAQRLNDPITQEAIANAKRVDAALAADDLDLVPASAVSGSDG